MKKIFVLIIFSFFFQIVHGQLNFSSDEKLFYEMGYGFITGGEATMTLEEINYEGKKAYHCKAVGKTVGLADKIFDVYDVYESIFDPNTCLPYKAIRNIHEDTYEFKNSLLFDHENKKLVSQKSGEHKLEHDMVFDVISAFYFLRKSDFKDIKKGKIIKIHTFFHDEPWDLIVRFKGYDVIKTEFGKVKCLKFKPIVEEGVFEDEDALSIWISADKNRLPIKVEMDLFIGSFKTELVKYENLKYPLELHKK